ncbi:hypothetical protein OEV98_16120 [Caldibacillus lycopersici]|uniref:Uncharacterized protein n=1 Tax=Perspicuibacillus lycopersici TaxID=1325689 RepID=A0AAE3IVN1_9BACI|nr:hypothetical protein [Perspicuibacillus lycopersici]MCU9615062.1 hypothetical protein [Perspicuibacillus lycopersici]
MGKILSGFYLLAGILCTVCIFTSFFNGFYVLSSWLLVAALINFSLYRVVWNSVRKENEQKHETIRA